MWESHAENKIENFVLISRVMSFQMLKGEGLKTFPCKELQLMLAEPCITTGCLTWSFSCVSPDLSLVREVQTYSIKILMAVSLRSFWSQDFGVSKGTFLPTFTEYYHLALAWVLRKFLLNSSKWSAFMSLIRGTFELPAFCTAEVDWVLVWLW